MASYGRNVEVVTMPLATGRQSYCVPTTAFGSVTSGYAPLGVPVTVDTSAALNALNLQPLKVAAADTPRDVGQGQGVLIYEYAPAAFANFDPELTLYSDLDFAPLGAAVQLLHGVGDGVQILLRNTSTSTFLNTRSYPGRTMVAGLAGATPTIQVGDYLTPGVGSDAAGWWKETATAANAWLKVVSVDNTRAECVAELVV